MIDTQKLKKRDLYLKKLIAFQDTEPVKVVTGVRRSGKSSLFKLMVLHLKEEGISEEQILVMNFESYAFKDMTCDTFYEYVKQQVLPDKRMYLFFDEIQRVPHWEKAVNSFRVDFNCDIYVTGSNAYMLSSEYATYLSGRYVEIKMLPLSFSEFLSFYDFEVQETKNNFGVKHKQVFDHEGNRYDLREVFDLYMRFGGMPGILDVGFDQEKAWMLLEGIYNTVIIRDILERENRKNQKTINNPFLLRKIVLFLADNIGGNISLSSIGNVLTNENLLENDKKKGKPSTHTVQSYVTALQEAYFFYEIKRFDIKGKQFLKTLGKYYIVDIGLRNYLLGIKDRNRGRAVENVIYFELLRRGYDVSVGKVDEFEIDFIATNANTKKYFQVTESMTDEEVRKRERTPLLKIHDNYEKTILTLNTGMDTIYDGVRSLSLIDWLLEDEKDY